MICKFISKLDLIRIQLTKESPGRINICYEKKLVEIINRNYLEAITICATKILQTKFSI